MSRIDWFWFSSSHGWIQSVEILKLKGLYRSMKHKATPAGRRYNNLHFHPTNTSHLLTNLMTESMYTRKFIHELG